MIDQLTLQIALGTLFNVITIIISVAMIGFAMRVLLAFANRLTGGNHAISSMLALSVTTIWLVFVVTVNVWLWAFAYLVLGVFGSLEESLFFSMVSFTTLGFGDVLLPQDWRLLAGFNATSGFILFGLGTAFLFEIMQRYYSPRHDRTKKH